MKQQELFINWLEISSNRKQLTCKEVVLIDMAVE
jgi:hypothetical protein